MTMAYDRRRRLVRAFAPAVGLLAAGLLVWQGSYAAFSGTTPDTANVWTAGSLTLQNNGSGSFAASSSAVFGGTNFKPGFTSTATCITVKNTGSLAGNLGMYLSGPTLPLVSPLGDKIYLTIDEATVATAVPANCTGFPASPTNVETSTALTALKTTYATAKAPIAMAASGMVAYRLVWTFDAAAPNTLQGATVTADFTWEIQ